jgi:DNA-binding FrmR family transcriptional regulator
MTIQKKKALIALKKAHTSIEYIIKMIEDKKYCIDIIQQNLAVIGLLKSSHQLLLENHLETCFSNAMNAKNSKIKKDMVNEIIKISRLSSK